MNTEELERELAPHIRRTLAAAMPRLEEPRPSRMQPNAERQADVVTLGTSADASGARPPRALVAAAAATIAVVAGGLVVIAAWQDGGTTPSAPAPVNSEVLSTGDANTPSQATNTSTPPPATNPAAEDESSSTVSTIVFDPIDWTDPPPASSFDQIAEWGALARQADVLYRDTCMADRGLDYRLPPFGTDPTIVDGPDTDAWQQWYDDTVASTPGWEAQLFECADEFLNSGWAGDVNASGYAGDLYALGVTGRQAVWNYPHITALIEEVVGCAGANGATVSTPVAEDPEQAYEEADDALGPLIGAILDDIPDGVTQQEYFESRERAFDEVCPAYLDLDRALLAARRDVERQWLIDNPGTAQRISDEWADDILRLREIIAGFQRDAPP